MYYSYSKFSTHIQATYFSLNLSVW